MEIRAEFSSFHASISFFFPVVAIHFSSITELKLFSDDATNQTKKVICTQWINAFQANVFFLYSLKLLENQRLDVFIRH